MGAQLPTRTPLAIKRAGRRVRLSVMGKMLGAMGEQDIRLKDLSKAGASAESQAPPRIGDEVVAVFAGITMPCRIVWVVGQRFGMAFHTQVGQSDIETLTAGRTLSAGTGD